MVRRAFAVTVPLCLSGPDHRRVDGEVVIATHYVPPMATGRASSAAAFAAVYASPLLDGPRAVLGDALLEQQVPLGEFIQLQLHRARGKRGTLRREREIFEAHKHALWPDHPVSIARAHLSFEDVERGFPWKFNPHGDLDVQQHARLAKHPGWSTIRWYRAWPDESLGALLPDDMPQLQALLDLSLELLDGVRDRSWPVETLSLSSAEGKTRPLTGLTSLRKLSLRSDHDLAATFERLGPSGLLERITELEVFTAHSSFATVLQELSKLPKQVRSLSSRGMTLTRAGKSFEATVVTDSFLLDETLAQLAALPTKKFASVKLELLRNGFFTRKTRPLAEAASRKVLARFARSTLT
jgi:hypothetical protein